VNARQTALAILQKNEKAGQYTNLALDHALKDSTLSSADRALVATLVYGVTERRITLDYVLSTLVSRPLSELDADALFALRLGLYQLMYLDRIPQHAAIYETVNICRRRSAGFVNAVLRAYTRLREPVAFPNVKDEPVRALSVCYSVCERLAERLIASLGAEQAEAYLAATLQTPPTTLRVNTARIRREELAERIEGSELTPLSPHGLYVKGAVRELYGFEEGLFFVQDEASQICVEALGAKAGECVLDICACPGSKSFGAAMSMEGRGEIFAFDLHESKLSLVVSGAKRLGILIPKTQAADGRVPKAELIGTADRIICDVPCSGYGVLAKKPELRYKDPAISASLPQIQTDILENCSTYLKSGGTLVYSTCTVLGEENEQVVQAFLRRHSEFSLTPFAVGELSCERGMITLYPHIHHTDGFFIAKLTKA